MTFQKKILITGGAGFIGSHLIRRLVARYPDNLLVNLDKLTYAGNLENLTDVAALANYKFVKGDICHPGFLSELFRAYDFQAVIHLAAESHVDRSISDPLGFIHTNIEGTVHLLNTARDAWKGDYANRRFYQISTDEVFGSLGPTGYFTETTPYDPRSPYSASKASADHLVRAYGHTYGLPVLVSNCSNNYGPYQFPEKLIPLMINNIRLEKSLPVYGDGQNIRDWLWVEDHAEAIDLILHKGKVGDTYNIGGNNELRNLELVEHLCDIMDRLLGRPEGYSRKLITFVHDRPGHDHRYAIDAAKIKRELGWTPTVKPLEGLAKTAKWYLENTAWLEHITSGAYLDYYEKQYGKQ